MAADFDNPPVYDPLTETTQEKMSQEWITYISTLIETLTEYLTQYGIFAPLLTTEQRDSIQSPVNGQLIYNTTLNKFQGFEAGAWVNLV